MQVPLDITFRNSEPSEAIRSEVEKQAKRLEKFHDRITSCHVRPTGQLNRPIAGRLAYMTSHVLVARLRLPRRLPAGPRAYLLVTYSWLLFYRSYPAEQARASFVNFVLDKGQSYALDLGYLVLPPPMFELGKAALSKIR
jgi:hypothetical protein